MLRWESLLRGPFHFDDFTWNCIMLECDKIFPKKFYKQYFYWRVYSYLQLESHDVMNLCQENVSSFNKLRLFHIWCYSMKCTIEKNELEAFSGLIYSPHLQTQPGFFVKQEFKSGSLQMTQCWQTAGDLKKPNTLRIFCLLIEPKKDEFSKLWILLNSSKRIAGNI